MALICVFGARECDGSCLHRCQPEEEEKKTKLYCDYCGEEIEAVYYKINGEILCPPCLDETYGDSLLYE
jgi:formylmethanofuran dehydrogenase subunit E